MEYMFVAWTLILAPNIILILFTGAQSAILSVSHSDLNTLDMILILFTGAQSGLLSLPNINPSHTHTPSDIILTLLTGVQNGVL